MNLFEWIKNKKELEEEIEEQDRTIMNLQIRLSKLHTIEKEYSILNERTEDYVETIKELRKEIRKLKKEIKELKGSDK